MRKKSLARTIALYVSMLVLSIGLLVGWILYVVYFSSRFTELLARLGGAAGGISHWVIMTVGIVLFILLIVGLSWQLALSISDVRYNRKQDEFVANITHELKSPLAAIRLHAQSLQEEGLSPDQIKASLDHILQQEKRMIALVENIIEISRLKSKLKFKSESLSVSVREFLEDYKSDVVPKLETHKMKFDLQVGVDVMIQVPVKNLTRILDNLIDNAIKASQPGQKIGISTKCLADNLEIAVQDEGHGIKKADQKKIFNRFYQIGSEIRGRRSGTGLGLSIVSELVKEMKGKIRVESGEFLEGTRFVITLPLEKEKVT